MPRRPLDHHDEPFVIDNFPFEIDVGEIHGTREGLLERSGDNWIRHATDIDRLLLLKRRESGKEGYDFESYKVNTAHGITVRLGDGNSLHLSIAPGKAKGETALTIIPQLFKLKKNGKRRLKKSAGTAPRITEIKFLPQGSAEPKEIPVPVGAVYLLLYKGV
jgi:hypothetical protein